MKRYTANKNAMKDYRKRMIYAQHSPMMKSMRYLKTSMSDTGCEIIACYNLMKKLNKNCFLAGVILEFEMNAMYIVRSGRYGSDPYLLDKYLNAHNVNTEWYISKKNFLKNTKTGKKCGIFSYWNNNGKKFWSGGIHTVAYWYDKKEKKYYLPNLNCDGKIKKPIVKSESEFKNLINSKAHFIIGYTVK